MELINQLKEVCADVRQNEMMNRHTTFRIGGAADIFLNVGKSELCDVLSVAQKNGTKVTVIGNGSNLLVGDAGIRGIVIMIGERMNKITVSDNEIYAESGALLSKISNVCINNSLTGFESLSGIPGSLGGAIYMNAGAYTTEIKDVLKSCEVLTKDGIKTFYNDELEFSYRKSRFTNTDNIILSGVIELKNGDKEKIEEAVREFTKRRNEKQPVNYPSAGSTFKRPEGYFAAKLIDDCGLRGYSTGGAKISEKHAGFIINYDSASAKDVLNLIQYVQGIVYEKFGVNLETEVKIIGE